jgi:signal transduction histidine kinase
MAASIGHEVRNPMTTVRGYLQLFQRKEHFAEHAEQINTMIEELDRANSIITEFLSLAKNKTVNMKIGNLNTVIHALYPLLQADALRRGHEVLISLDDIPNSEFDENEIRQLILNLVRNGLEAMQHEGVVTIRTYTNANRLILSVEDTGVGIQAEVLPKLGMPFITTKENGTGLGLPVCYRVAERHGAKISIQTGNTGTTFIIQFYLPVV